MSDAFTRPPKENLFRALNDGLTLTRSEGEPMPTMQGHFAVFNEWTEIRSRYEGRFLEQIAPGAFAKTFSENRDRIRVLFEHGFDPVVGNKPLGAIRTLQEDETGAYYEVPLLDTSYVREILPGLEEGLYGASFRFTVMKDDMVRTPRRSAHNPEGIPERTITEARVPEFGPVTFPAYQGATAGLRSITDDVLIARLEGREGTDPARGHATASIPADVEDEARSERRYNRVVERVGSTAWALHPDMLATIVSIVAERADGQRPSDDEVAERIGTRAARPEIAAGPVAVVRLHGPIIPRADAFSEVSGLTSVESFRTAFRSALASADVKSILLDVDSPGGDVSLVPEMAAEILDARGTKPIVAVANTWAASAAYWIASAADELYVTDSGEVGSVGVWSAHDDISAAQKKLGVKTTLVSAGKYKVERNPFQPLSADAKAEMQRKVDTYYEMFVDGVAAGRGVSADTVRSDFGQGRMVMPDEALAKGMVDGIATFDETLARLTADASEAADVVEESEPSTATTPVIEPEPSEATTPERRRARLGALKTNQRKEERPSWQL